MSKFNFKESPLFHWVSSIAGYVIHETDTEIDNQVAADIKEAIENSINYDGNLADLVSESLDIALWALNKLPKFANSFIDELVFSVVSSSLQGILGGNGQKREETDGIIKRLIAGRKEEGKGRWGRRAEKAAENQD